MSDNQPAKSKALSPKLIYAAATILKENGGELPARAVMDEVEKRLQLDDWARERYEKTGTVRWQVILRFMTLYATKAGFLIKKKGRWYLTPEGESALKLGEQAFDEAVENGYREWSRKNRQSPEPNEFEEPSAVDAESEQEMTVDEIEQLALDGIKNFIYAKNPYEFQDLAAALLRAMGYFTPFVAPRGKDGGVDIVAYRDPLGTQAPRIKIQIKHKEAAAPVQDVRQLMGLLQKDGDVGIFFSTGGFTPDAKATARSSHVHVELIDLERFIGLWQEFYDKLTDEDKSMLPLLPIYFVAPST